MKLTVFNVEHGACALIEMPNGSKALIDCGHNATTGWRPGTYLKSRGIDRVNGLFVTNYDEDHVSGIENLFAHVKVSHIIRNRKVSADHIRRLKSEDGMGKGIDFLVNTLSTYTVDGTFEGIGLDGVRLRVFSNSLIDFDDENNLSLVVFLEYQGWKFVFPGDLEDDGWLELLKNPEFRAELAGVNIFFASHHGRLNGCCDEVFEICAPHCFVISDKAKGFQTQETTDWYRQRAKGLNFNGEVRKVLTTRKDGHMEFKIIDRILYAKPVCVSVPGLQRI